LTGAPDATAFDVDVVVVNYNAGDHLLACVGSVFEAAGGAEAKVFVVDNDSSDGSAERVKEAFPRVELISNAENRGFGAAANQGIAAGSSPFVFLLNPDARISAGALRDLLSYVGQRDRVGAVGVLTRDPDGSVYPSARTIPTFPQAAGHALIGPFKRDNRFSRAYTMSDWDRTSEREVDWVSGSSMLLRRRAIDSSGPFDEAFFMYAEDADLCTRIREAGWQVMFTPVIEVTHDHGLSTRGSRRMIREHSRSIYIYFEKHHAQGWRKMLLPAVRAVVWARAEIVSRRMWRP
jgi:GT2 family glycosyltransferase